MKPLCLVALLSLGLPLAACGDDSGGGGGAGGGESTNAATTGASTSTSSTASSTPTSSTSSGAGGEGGDGEGGDGEGGDGEGGDGEGGAGGNGEGGNPVDPEAADFETLDACNEASTCETGVVENGLDERVTPEGISCVLAALSDRTAGTYRVRFEYLADNAYHEIHHVLVVQASGEVAVGWFDDRIQHEDMEPGHEYEPTTLCTLKEPAFFDACLAAVEDDDELEALECIWPDSSDWHLPWFDDCEEAAPVCE